MSRPKKPTPIFHRIVIAALAAALTFALVQLAVLLNLIPIGVDAAVQPMPREMFRVECFAMGAAVFWALIHRESFDWLATAFFGLTLGFYLLYHPGGVPSTNIAKDVLAALGALVGSAGNSVYRQDR